MYIVKYSALVHLAWTTRMLVRPSPYELVTNISQYTFIIYKDDMLGARNPRLRLIFFLPPAGIERDTAVLAWPRSAIGRAPDS